MGISVFSCNKMSLFSLLTNDFQVFFVTLQPNLELINNNDKNINDYDKQNSKVFRSIDRM